MAKKPRSLALDNFTNCEVFLFRAYRYAQASEGGNGKIPGWAEEIKAWIRIVEKIRWHNPVEVRCTFKDADPVDDYVAFDFRNNRYRLITVIHYAKTTDERETEGHVYIRSFLTHKEYDNRSNWDRRYGRK